MALVPLSEGPGLDKASASTAELREWQEEMATAEWSVSIQ